MQNDSPWMDLTRAAAYAGASVTTLRRAVASGELVAYRISAGRLIRLRVDDVELWMKRARVSNLGT
jgi:excisionase family DNA binding protein